MLDPGENAKTPQTGDGGTTGEKAAASGDETKAASGGDSADQTKVAATKPDEVQPFDREATMLDWLAKYDGGKCFYVTPMQISGETVRVEGFATSVPPFEKLDGDFKAAHGIEADIQARLIHRNQCAVAEFLHAIQSSQLTRPTLLLSSSNVKSGESLSGALGKVAGGSVSLLLIDNEGVVYNLQNFLKKDGDKATFNIKLVDLETRDPLPQLILALSSNEEIKTIQKAEPELASALLERILKSVRNGELQVSGVAKFFRLGG